MKTLKLYRHLGFVQSYLIQHPSPRQIRPTIPSDLGSRVLGVHTYNTHVKPCAWHLAPPLHLTISLSMVTGVYGLHTISEGSAFSSPASFADTYLQQYLHGQRECFGAAGRCRRVASPSKVPVLCFIGLQYRTSIIPITTVTCLPPLPPLLPKEIYPFLGLTTVPHPSARRIRCC